jgi:hypothetical protein
MRGSKPCFLNCNRGVKTPRRLKLKERNKESYRAELTTKKPNQQLGKQAGKEKKKKLAI